MRLHEAVILAAGRGTRLDPITRSRPKHLLPIAGRPLLEWQLEFLAKVGVKRVIIVKHYKGYLIEEVARNEANKLGLQVDFIEQRKLLGTAHALGITKEAVNPPFFLIYGDVTIIPYVLKSMINTSPKFEAIVAAVRVNDPWNYGVFNVNNGLLVDIIEKPPKGAEPSNLINSGIYLFRSKLIYDCIQHTKLSPRGEFELTDSLKILAKKASVKVIEFERDWWFDIGKPWDLLQANKAFLNKFLRKKVALSKIVKLHNKVRIIPPVYIGANVKIEEEAILGPNSVICDEVEIKRGARISHSIVMEGTLVGEGACIDHSIIGRRVQIGEGVKIISRWRNKDLIWVAIKGNLVCSGCYELGAIIGDGAIIEDHTMMVPGIVVMPGRRVKGTLVIEDVL